MSKVHNLDVTSIHQSANSSTWLLTTYKAWEAFFWDLVIRDEQTSSAWGWTSVAQSANSVPVQLKDRGTKNQVQLMLTSSAGRKARQHSADGCGFPRALPSFLPPYRWSGSLINNLFASTCNVKLHKEIITSGNQNSHTSSKWSLTCIEWLVRNTLFNLLFIDVDHTGFGSFKQENIFSFYTMQSQLHNVISEVYWDQKYNFVMNCNLVCFVWISIVCI